MGFKPVSYEEIKKNIVEKLRIPKEFFETDDGTADSGAKSIIQPETTQEAWDRLLGDIEVKTFSGSLEDIRGRLMVK